MAKGAAIPYDVARPVAERLVKLIEPIAEKVAIAGSLRRNRPEVHDVDLVVICDHVKRVRLLYELLTVKTQGTKVATADKIWKLVVDNVPVDIYFADAASYPMLLVVRTGSAGHNVKLGSWARSHGMAWHADGSGIDTPGGLIRPQSEEDVFEVLGLPYRPPEDREV